MKYNHICLTAAALMFTLSPVFAQTSGGGATGSTGSNALGAPNGTITGKAGSGSSSNINSGSGTGTGTTVGSTSGNSAIGSNARANWGTENTYWQDHYSSAPYYSNSRNYSIYAPAYQYGVDLYNKNPGVPYSSLNQEQLNSGWSNARNQSQLDWSDAQLATRDAYNRLYENRGSMPSATQ